jgi:oligoribonuclease
MPKYPQCLLWVDLETPGLPGPKNDYSVVPIMEVAFIITDFDLEPYDGYHEAIKMDRHTANILKGNDYVRDMHTKNGLIKDCIASTVTIEEAEAEVIKMLQERTSFDKGEIMLAGSGNAAFDRPVINQWMPELASWLAYYPFDIGVDRRIGKILAREDVINIPSSSVGYGDAKVHRAWNDVQAHIEEARRKGVWYREAVDAIRTVKASG